MYELLNTFNTVLTVAVASAITLTYYYGDDALRMFKILLYSCGYTKGDGKGVVPGPWGDTRFTRFSHGATLAVQWRQQYGSLYRVFCGSIPEIVVTDPDDVRKLYSGDSRTHLKTINTSFGVYMGKVLGLSVGFLDRDDWKRVRLHTDPHWTAAMTKESVPSMLDDTVDWINQLPSLPVVRHDPANEKDLIIESADLQSELPFKMIARRLFGETMDEKLFRELYSLNKVHERIMANAFLVGKIHQWKLVSYLPTKANYDNKWFQKHWAELLHRVAREGKEKGISTAVGVMYDTMQSGGMSFDEFSHTVDEMLFTNFDGATMSVSWVVTLVAQNPDIQARLVAEIAGVLKDETLGATRSERLTAYMMKTNSLLHYCCLEASRLNPVLYFALPEVIHEAKTLGGYYLPKHSSIIIDAFTINRTAPIWGKDAEVYRPDRFATLSPADYRYSLWRFGMGPRKCVGQYFGDKMVKVCLFQIIEQYEVTAFGNLGIRSDKFVSSPAATLRFRPRAQLA
ncbi:cytochrome P450 [Leucogyrophana mollusca]|uniref:Cytochrome P450 n=1 Tax=Leucogyrophana mollusca TaxID=85980 RepID=A0ACB8B769_9AGAM|nr:cytochrome P450 [Leucogyrophana mollusca]